MAKSQKTKTQTQASQANVLESLKNLGTGISQDFLDQILARRQYAPRPANEIKVGESLRYGQAAHETFTAELKLRKQIAFERRLLEEERAETQKKTNELKVQLQALMQEAAFLAQSTQTLNESVKVAVLQAPAQPGIYHLFFFEKLIEFIQSFRQKIDSAAVWLTALNKRAEKKNYWTMYKKKGASFLLSGEHYLQRSAG